MAKNLLITSAAAVAGGIIFTLIHIPMPWLLGPVAATLVLGNFRPGNMFWPLTFREAGQLVLGYMMGRPFTADVCLHVLSQLPTMLAMTVFLIACSIAAGYVTHRQTGLSLPTAVLAAIPGGQVQMVVLAAEIPGADAGVVTVIQALRMLAVVFTVPFLTIHGLGPTGPAAAPPQAAVAAAGPADVLAFVAVVLAGAWLARRIHLPTPYLLGPVLATIPLVVYGLPAPAVPQPLLIAAQICVGAYMGTTIDFATLGDWRKILLLTFTTVIVLLLASLLAGYALAFAIPADLVTAFLSAAPGGMAEMCLTALVLGGDVSVVTGYNMFRVLFILLVLPLFFRRWLKGREPA
jgi:membrane AbrB-like protein